MLVHDKKIPLRKALIYVFLSVLLIWGSLCLAWWYHSRTLQKRQQNPRYTINAIAQLSHNEPIPSWQLAEVLELSHDVHSNLYCFDTAIAVERLQSCPVIKKATVRKSKPGTIHVDYETRVAEAFIADYDNMACDREGTIFPLQPFFSPKNLPEIYLGLRSEKMTWDQKIESEKLDLAFAIIDFVNLHFPSCSRLLRVDVHEAFALSAGKQEIVLLFDEENNSSFVRLKGRAFEKSLTLFLALQAELKKMRNETIQIVDLRSPGLVLVK